MPFTPLDSPFILSPVHCLSCLYLVSCSCLLRPEYQLAHQSLGADGTRDLRDRKPGEKRESCTSTCATRRTFVGSFVMIRRPHYSVGTHRFSVVSHARQTHTSFTSRAFTQWMTHPPLIVGQVYFLLRCDSSRPLSSSRSSYMQTHLPVCSF
jgi:hypothetical protein